ASAGGLYARSPLGWRDGRWRAHLRRAGLAVGLRDDARVGRAFAGAAGVRRGDALPPVRSAAGPRPITINSVAMTTDTPSSAQPDARLVERRLAAMTAFQQSRYDVALGEAEEVLRQQPRDYDALQIATMAALYGQTGRS